MRKIILAAALLLAACQTTAPAPVTQDDGADKLTFAPIIIDKRQAFYASMTGGAAPCLARVAQRNPNLSPDARAERCECIRRETAERMPEDLVDRTLDELRGKPQPATPEQVASARARVYAVTLASYGACGVNY